jgi:hypothetical protein
VAATVHPTYPFCAPPSAGTIGLRTFEAVADGTRRADIAAVCGALADDDIHVLATSTRVHALAQAIGRGWRDPLVHVSDATTLVSMTAAVYELWQRGDDTAVIIEDLMAPRTGPGSNSGHDDAIMLAWLRAVAAGDLDTLAELTGLDADRYLHSDATSRPTIVIAGARVRRSRRIDDLAGLMGGPELVAAADNVCAVEATESDFDHVFATATWVKGYDNPRTVLLRRRVVGAWQWEQN